jgi:hypothetical protein
MVGIVVDPKEISGLNWSVKILWHVHIIVTLATKMVYPCLMDRRWGQHSSSCQILVGSVVCLVSSTNGSSAALHDARKAGRAARNSKGSLRSTERLQGCGAFGIFDDAQQGLNYWPSALREESVR